LEGAYFHPVGKSDMLFDKALSLLSADSFHREEVLARWGTTLVRADYELSHKLLNEAIILHRKRGNVNELPWTLGSLIRLLRNHLRFTQAEQYIEEALHYSQLIRHPHAESRILNEAAYLSRYKGEFEKTWEIGENSYNLASQVHKLDAQRIATVLKLQIKYLLHEPVADIISELTTLINKAKGIHPPSYERLLDSTTQGAFTHSLKGDDTAARRAWQADIIETSPAKWLDIIAMEAVGHTSIGYDEFATVLVGHLATYGDDAVGWLKRWSRYQDSLVQLQSRLDEATYQKAYQRGKSLTLDEMVRELKTNTGMAVD
jgi:hypothetical protein